MLQLLLNKFLDDPFWCRDSRLKHHCSRPRLTEQSKLDRSFVPVSPIQPKTLLVNMELHQLIPPQA